MERLNAYSPVPMAGGDGVALSGAGVLHSITFSQGDALPTAGTIDFYDNTAGSGTKVFSVYFPAAAFSPCSVTLDCQLSNGLYVDNGPSDVNVTVTVGR